MTSADPPQNWHSAPVSDLISISHGFAFKGEYFSEYGKDAVTTPGNFLESGGFRLTGTKQRYYSGSIPEPYRLNAGDLIVAMTEQAEGLLGSTALVPSVGSWLHNQRIGRIRAKSDEISLPYLYYVFNSFEFRKSVAETAAGTKVKHTSPVKLGAVEILLPPRDEQDRIAGALDDADAMILGLERLIAKKRAIKQGMMQRLLTGRTRLPTFTDEWCEIALGDVAIIDPEALPSGTNPKTLLDYISLEDVERGELLGHTQVRFASAPSRARRVLRDLDVLFGTVRPNLQSHTLYQGGLKRPIASTGFSIVRAVSGRSDPLFLFHLLMSHLTVRQVDRIIAGSNYPAVSSGDVRRLTFEVPTIVEQKAIGAKLADCDAELSLLKARLAKARDAKQGMLQQLLTGHTRLPAKGSAA